MRPKSLVVCTAVYNCLQRVGRGSVHTLETACGAALTSGFRRPMGYGVIGNTADSGSAILGSSPGTPAKSHHRKRLGAPTRVSYAGSSDRFWPRRLAA